MQTELMAIGVQVALFVITSILGYRILMREKRAILTHVEEFVDQSIQTAIDEVGEALGQVFEKPIVKGAMTNLGKMGGAAMQDKAVMNSMALDILNTPKFAALKMAAKVGLNIDIDEYIEEHGMMETIRAAKGIGDQLGIDVLGMLTGDMNGTNLSVGYEANGGNYYLGAR